MSMPGPERYPEDQSAYGERPTPPIVPAELAAPRSPYSGSPRTALWAVLAVLLAILLTPYLAQQISYAIARGRELARRDVAEKELANLPAGANRNPAVAKIMEPSVVGIQTKIRVPSPFGDADWFRPSAQGRAQGSGVIVDKEGYILTNAHVLSQAQRGGVTVQLNDGRTIENATIVGTDPANDLAVLKIDATELVAAGWGDSDAIEVGDSVLAIGSPYGLAETVTAGIISAKNRSLGIENQHYGDFLQTDAAVNPGNSGGPLVNMNAQLVGINTAIVGRAYQGIGFAIPSNLAKQVYESLRTSTPIQRGWIGVGIQDVDQSLAEKLDLKDTRGALVSEVRRDSPAAVAGLRAGDVIVQWDDRAVTNSTDLRIAVARTKPGARATVSYYRDGKQQQTTITVDQRPNQVAE